MNNSNAAPGPLNIAFAEEDESTVLVAPGHAINLTNNSTVSKNGINLSVLEEEQEAPSAIAPVINNGSVGHFLNDEMPDDIEPVANNGPVGHFLNDEMPDDIEPVANNGPVVHFLNDEMPNDIEPVANNGPAGHFLNNSTGHARKRKQAGGRKTYRKKRASKGKSRRAHKRLSYRQWKKLKALRPNNLSMSN